MLSFAVRGTGAPSDAIVQHFKSHKYISVLADTLGGGNICKLLSHPNTCIVIRVVIWELAFGSTTGFGASVGWLRRTAHATNIAVDRFRGMNTLRVMLTRSAHPNSLGVLGKVAGFGIVAL